MNALWLLSALALAAALSLLGSAAPADGLLLAAAAMMPPRRGFLGAHPRAGGEASETEPPEFWRRVVDAIPDAAMALHADGTVAHLNRQTFEIFANARPGLNISRITRNPDLIAAIERSGETPQPRVVEILERIPVGRRLSAVVSQLAPTSSDPRLPTILVTFRDLSESDRLDAMRADFVANASHELRTPLASLRGYIETLQGAAHNDPAARERFLAIMWSQAARMTRLIDDLLSLSRIEMRVHLPPKAMVDLNDIVLEVAQMLQPIADEAKIAVKLHRLEGPARVRGDRDELVQVFQNLVQNAVKYGRPGGKVEISVYRQEGVGRLGPRLVVDVADDGPGIAAQHLPRLTERFYRVNVASSREKGGTGLGLAIVRHIVLRHRGDLKIASTLGKGSTFTVLLDALET